TDAMRGLADGDLKIGVPCTGDSDEIGHMARAVEVFKRHAIDAKRLGAEQDAARAAKERRHTLMEVLTHDFGDSVSGVMRVLTGSTETMVEAADAMSRSALRAHREASATAERADKSSHDLASIAAAIRQMTASVEEIARQVASAVQSACAASEHAAQS